jgi:integrase
MRTPEPKQGICQAMPRQARPDPVVLSPSSVPDQAQPVAQSITDKTNLSGEVNRNKSNAVAKTGGSWVFVYETLNNEIKLRHYSPKTLKAYRGWTRQFQAFIQSKDYNALSQQDVVEFLTYLAVKQQVSASSQNQAFNALLFLYKQVLKKESGEIKGVARAKRRPYVPVVLSREEIDLIFDHLDDPVNLMALVLYGCGLRLFEWLTLRGHCFTMTLAF